MLHLWAKRPSGLSPLSRASLATTVGSAHCNSGISIFPFELFKIFPNLLQTLEICRNSIKL
jgi:hypothetical protein